MTDHRRSTESLSGVIGDARHQVEDAANQVRGAARDLYGQARKSTAQVADAATGSVSGARKTAFSLEHVLRDTIENQPYTAVAIGVALGWLLGRTHRPL